MRSCSLEVMECWNVHLVPNEGVGSDIRIRGYRRKSEEFPKSSERFSSFLHEFLGFIRLLPYRA